MESLILSEIPKTFAGTFHSILMGKLYSGFDHLQLLQRGGANAGTFQSYLNWCMGYLCTRIRVEEHFMV